MIDCQMVENMKREVQLAGDKDSRKLVEESSKMKDLAEVWQGQCESLKRHEEQVRRPIHPDSPLPHAHFLMI
jgi:hypothetical protein